MIVEQLQGLAHPLKKLKLLPGNPRKGDVEAVKRSYERFGQRKPIVALPDGTVIAGNHQFLAAKALGWDEMAVVFVDDDDQTAKAFALADNRTSDLGTYDSEALAELLADVAIDPELLMATGYTQADLDALLGEIEELPPVIGDPDDVPESAPAKTIKGDVWLLGPHRLMCGDSTVPTDVERLMNGKKVVLLHADPPYGMGKQKDGVLNDNLYRDKLDAFQMSWWATYRPFLEDNASAYIWGNPEDLWRLWYVGGLKDSEELQFSNEITWDKSSAIGMRSELQLTFPVGSERCLVFRLGQQYVGNINTADFPEHWEPLRSYLHNEAEKVGIKPKTIKELCGVAMYSHWFSKSQFHLIPEQHYLKLQQAFPSAFAKDWEELQSEWKRVRGSGRVVINGMLEGMRSYFDNTHDNMTDVWTFSRVHGEERHGHATPKPVDMIARAIKSSAPKGTVFVEPFAGSGSTLMAAHQSKRICYTMELDERYCDIVCKRWEQATGITPIHEATKRDHSFLD
jgi:DNA modification methylase